MLRNIIKRFTVISNFSTEVQKSTGKGASTSGLTYYKDGQLVNRTSITLKKQ
jgi:hypothetical protein